MNSNRCEALSWRCLLAVAAFTLAWVMTEQLAYGIAERYSYYQIVGMRYSVHLIALLGIMVIAGRVRRSLATRHPGWQLARGFCMFVMPASFLLSSSHVSGSFYLLALWAAPAIGALIAWRWLGERIPARDWWFMGIAYLATALLLDPAWPSPDAELVGPALGALSLAAYFAITRRLQHESILTSLFYTALGALLCMLPFTMYTWTPVLPADLPAIASVGLSGMAALWCMDRTIEMGRISVVGPLLGGEVLWRPVLTYVFDGPSPTPRMLLGALIFAGLVVWVIRATARRNAPAIL